MGQGRSGAWFALRLAVLAALGALAVVPGASAQDPSPVGGLVNGVIGQPPASDSSPAAIGDFTAPFTEPKIGKVKTSAKCLKRKDAPGDPTFNGQSYNCKPAGGALNVMPGGKVLYWNALEGTENVKVSIVAEYGHNAANDQSRVLNLHGDPSGRKATWSKPRPNDGGANPKGDPTREYLLPKPLTSQETVNDGALFCSDQTFLPDGRIMANGGTDYYNEPNVKVGKGEYGVAELEGLKQSRIFNPKTGKWTQTGTMKYGRWYPTTLELADGNIFTASGVTKLLKPVYPTHPGDSGTNVKQTETYDVLSGKWKTNPSSADQSLPLFPRLSLLPDGKVFYNANGQAFNPFGQSYDEALWNFASVYDPKKQNWTRLGVPGLTDLKSGSSLDPASAIKDAGSALQQGDVPGGGSSATLPGFRGSTFSMMLPLAPGADGRYSKASFLTAGGVLNPPSPGSYFATSDSRITTVDTAGGTDKMSTEPTGDLPGPRWYPSGVSLPTGQVIAFNGADRDEVVGPGVEVAKRQAEMFDPATKQWTPLAFSHDERTYHNTAALLPDGRVLIGGHAPISTLYLNDTTLPGGVTAPNNGRDPSFEIYTPPYLHWGARPKIAKAPRTLGYAKTFKVRTNTDSGQVQSVTLVRNTSTTHLVDGNQRTVVLPVVGQKGHTLTVKAPPSANVAPPGPYMLFVNKKSPKGAIPSKAAQMFVGIGGLEAKAHQRAAKKKHHHKK